MCSVSAYLELARWQNCLIAAAGVLVGAWWAGWGPVPPIALAAGAAVAISVATFSFNDVMDQEIDYLFKPHRPVAGGFVSPRRAVLIAVVFALAGIALSAAVMLALAAVTIGVLAIAAGYSFLKRSGLPGNLAAAVVASLPFLYGACAVGNPRAGLSLVAIAAPLHFAREIAKDIDDEWGDRTYRRTVPIRWGGRAAQMLILVAVLGFVVQIILIVRARPGFELLMLPAFLLTGIGALRAIHGKPGAPLVLKAAMLCTMLAFVIARI